MKTTKDQPFPLHPRRHVTTAFTVLALGMAGLGLDALVRPAFAQHAEPAAQAHAKVPAEHTLRLHGAVVALEGDTLTVGAAEGHQKVQKRLTLAPDVAITLASDKKHETHAGRRSDLVPGIGVALTLGADGTTVRAIEIMGRNAHGAIAAVDATSITITGKTKDGPTQEKFALTPATVIVLSHGTEKGSAQTGTAADLKVNMPVTVALSAVDRGSARVITVQPMKAHAKPAK
jgi:hypothetical protein